MTVTKIHLASYLAVVLVIAMLTACVAGSSPTKSDNSPEELLSLGEKYITEFEYEEALVQFLNVIEIEPMNERAYHGAAEAYVGLGKNDKAVEILEKGLAALPESVEIKGRLETAYLEIGDSFLDNNQFKQAPAAFGRVIELNPLNARAYLGAAEAHTALEQNDQAIEVLKLGYEKTQHVEIEAKLDELLEQLTLIDRLNLEKDVLAKVEVAKEINSDTVGWLSIPDTEIDYPVVFYPDPEDRNSYYNQRTFDKQESPHRGVCCSADYRCTFGNYLNALSNNTTIYCGTFSRGEVFGYGRTFNDVFKFNDLYLFENEEFARAHPYIYFATSDEIGVWEILTVSYLNANLPNFPYNSPTLSDDDFGKILAEAQTHSLYNYSETFMPGDKVITLSTNVGFVAVEHPYDKLVVIAKLVKGSNNLKESAAFTVNPNAAVRPVPVEEFNPVETK